MVTRSSNPGYLVPSSSVSSRPKPFPYRPVPDSSVLSLKAQRAWITECQGITGTRPLRPKCRENPCITARTGTEHGPRRTMFLVGQFRTEPARGPTPQALILSFLHGMDPCGKHYFSMTFLWILRRV